MRRWRGTPGAIERAIERRSWVQIEPHLRARLECGQDGSCFRRRRYQCAASGDAESLPEIRGTVALAEGLHGSSGEPNHPFTTPGEVVWRCNPQDKFLPANGRALAELNRSLKQSASSAPCCMSPEYIGYVLRIAIILTAATTTVPTWLVR